MALSGNEYSSEPNILTSEIITVGITEPPREPLRIAGESSRRLNDGSQHASAFAGPDPDQPA